MRNLEDVNKICIGIAELDESVLEGAIEEAKRQATYAHPLKTKTAGEIQDTGNKNLEILSKLKEIKKLMEG